MNLQIARHAADARDSRADRAIGLLRLLVEQPLSLNGSVAGKMTWNGEGLHLPKGRLANPVAS